MGKGHGDEDVSALARLPKRSVNNRCQAPADSPF